MIKRAIIVAAGLGTRFLPATKTIPKEMLFLVDRPVLHHLVDECLASGIKELVFVISPGKRRAVQEYFEFDPKRDSLLASKDRTGLYYDLCDLHTNARMYFVLQRQPRGNGHALLQARKFLDKPCVVLFGDDLYQGPKPATAQLLEAFQQVERPIIALSSIPKEKCLSYGIIKKALPAEALAKAGAHRNRIIRISDIVEKPKFQEAPSNLAVVGKYIITPEFVQYLAKTKPDAKGEIGMTGAIQNMLRDGRDIYGYKLAGEWIECGDRLDFIKSTVKLALAHPEFGGEFRKFLTQFKIQIS